MKSQIPFKPLAALFAGTLTLYFIAYTGIEHHRARNGPWRLAFTNDPAGAALLVINQPRLAITNVQIVFPGAALAPASPAAPPAWDQARVVPFDAGFGRCVFLDTTTQPGTVVLEIGGHEIQLLPRALTIDKKERPWQSGETISLYGLTTEK